MLSRGIHVVVAVARDQRLAGGVRDRPGIFLVHRPP